MALAYNREFVLSRLRACQEDSGASHLPNDLSSLVNYAGSIQSGDDAQSISTSRSDSSLSQSSAGGEPRITFEIGESDDDASLTDGHVSHRASSATQLDMEPMMEVIEELHESSDDGLHESDATPQAMNYLADDDSDLEERLFMVAAGQEAEDGGHAATTSPQLGPRKVSFTEPPVIEFAKRDVNAVLPSLAEAGTSAPTGTPFSHLSAAISSASDNDPLTQFLAASGTVDSSISVKIYFEFSDTPSAPTRLSVRGDAIVHQIIGYALHIYEKSSPLEYNNPNHYNLRLVDEDGEPDDDFPALERKRPFQSYSVDEIVLVEASGPEQEANQLETPFVQKQSTTRESITLESTATNITVRVYMYPFDHSLSRIYWAQALPSDTTASRVLEQVCGEKSLDGNDYVLRPIGSRSTINLDTPLMSLKPQPMAFVESSIAADEPSLVLSFELVPHRALKQEESVRSPSKRKNTTDSMPSSFSSAPVPMVPGLNFQRFGYYKYRVWRRQHVSFLGRQERELAIDGEYVYIMPPSDRSLLEAPKTTTFHIRQVIRCKQSSKNPVYLKIFVMKQAGPKRYDLDCMSSSDCIEIVEHINRLMKAF